MKEWLVALILIYVGEYCGTLHLRYVLKNVPLYIFCFYQPCVIGHLEKVTYNRFMFNSFHVTHYHFLSTLFTVSFAHLDI